MSLKDALAQFNRQLADKRLEPVKQSKEAGK